ncbi:hypothetical protein SSX86_011471 [Deinandra increscens subsp. villosa]|uniref:F-box domain-containing protein n=1 Tax=Deinandra increscens subsp. villosa TaxID=3103831 RepID=A0AAP0H2Q9_9ASTR
MSEKRHHNPHEIDQTDDDMIDYISNLPDSILHHILSFLPTKEVVKTSKLSKRWKTMWVSAPNLDFDDGLLYPYDVDFQHSTSFINFVERILSLRDASKIDKFRLSCCVCFNPSQISSWISNVIMHNVQELDLSIFSEYASVIPQSIFDCKSLVILKINLDHVIEIPSRISLPCLKTLHLSLVIFPNDDSTENLFSSCLVLEELALMDCMFMNLKNITISSLTLKRLTIHDLPCYMPSGRKIKIDAKNLTYLEFMGDLSSEVILNSVSSLAKACINIPYLYYYPEEVACCIVDILKRLQNVVFLSVSNCAMESLVFAGSMLDRFPVFPNLTHLVLTMKIWNDSFRGFMHFLNFCPTLQSIDLSEGFERLMRLDENDSIWLSVPLCISYHLKTLTSKNFQANDSEICFLKCVLKYARVLEKMNVSWCTTEPQDLKKRREVRKGLETTEKSCAACIIKFL